jgi:hypothetical protein
MRQRITSRKDVGSSRLSNSAYMMARPLPVLSFFGIVRFLSSRPVRFVTATRVAVDLRALACVRGLTAFVAEKPRKEAPYQRNAISWVGGSFLPTASDDHST